MRRYSRRRFLAGAGGLGAGIAAAALVGCTGDEGDPTATPDATRGRVRVRSLLPPTQREHSPAALHLGVLVGDVARDGLDPISRFVTYSRLVGVDPRSAAVYGDLAREIELPEPLTVRFGMRPGIYFHPNNAGEAFPLTAFEVARDFERRRDEGVFVFAEVIDSVEAPSESDLVVRLRAPFSLLFEFLARGDASVRGEGMYPTVPAPLGSGRFMPVLRETNALVLQPSPLLAEGEYPPLGTLVVHRGQQERDLDSSFAAGTLHVRHHPDAVSRELAASVPRRIEVTRPHQRMRGLALSLLPPRDQASEATATAFRDVRVRRALSLALDRHGLASIEGGVLSGPVGPAFAGDALPAVELEAHPLYQHNTEGARALLAAAGYEGLGIRISHAETALMLQMANAVVNQLEAAGFEPRLITRPQPEFEAAFLAGDFEAAFFELDRLTTPDIGLRLHTSGGLEGQRSPWGFSNPVYDAAVRDALSQVDPLQRTRKSRDAQRMLLDEVPAMLPLTAPPEFASLAPGVSGYEFNAYDFNFGVLAPQWQHAST